MWASLRRSYDEWVKQRSSTEATHKEEWQPRDTCQQKFQSPFHKAFVSYGLLGGAAQYLTHRSVMAVNGRLLLLIE